MRHDWSIPIGILGDCQFYYVLKVCLIEFCVYLSTDFSPKIFAVFIYILHDAQKYKVLKLLNQICLSNLILFLGSYFVLWKSRSTMQWSFTERFQNSLWICSSEIVKTLKCCHDLEHFKWERGGEILQRKTISSKSIIVQSLEHRKKLKAQWTPVVQFFT